MRQPIGEIIRHIRRMCNLTQSELGGDRYSKSYVSAIEHNKIAPSSEVLHFFAEQLGYPPDYFERVQEHPDLVQPLSTLDTPALPRLADSLTPAQNTFPRSPTSLVEVYFAAGEVAEALGRMATVQLYAHDCYVQANLYFEAAVALASSLAPSGEQDPGYLARLYQRCVTLLEERTLAAPTFYEETTRALIGILKNGFWQYQQSVLDKTLKDPGLKSY